MDTREAPGSRSFVSGTTLRWVVFCALLLAFILVPFVVLEGRIDALAQQTLQSGSSMALITLAVIGFLLADIVLPVPSSFVLSTTGYLLGIPAGTLVCFIGMTCASAAGYCLGRYAGGPLAQRIVGCAQLDRLAALSHRYGDLLVVAFRAMPVLAEATTILCGISRMPLPRFLAVVSLGNILVALIYVCIGAFSASRSSFVLGAVVSLVLPVLILLVVRRVSRSRAVA
jgi:uncharacterized membrane protein YdjX (TVP38/TMEM64 family)